MAEVVNYEVQCRNLLLFISSTNPIVSIIEPLDMLARHPLGWKYPTGVTAHSSRKDATTLGSQVESSSGSWRFSSPDVKFATFEINIGLTQAEQLFRSSTLVQH